MTDSALTHAAAPVMKFRTYTGIEFDPLAPRVEDIDIRDIAHALAQTCRFNGHISRFYSVAQHCVVVSELVPARLARLGLLHDASEAYIADVSRPVKYRPELAGYRDSEQRLQAVIYERFGWSPTAAAHIAAVLPPDVALEDDRQMAAEFRDLVPSAPFIWATRAGSLPKIRPLMPIEAELVFLRRFVELGA